MSEMTKSSKWSHLQDFGEYTSLHGIPFILKSAGYLLRFCWLAIILTCFALCFYQCGTSTQQYLAFRVKTSIVLQMIDDLDFPSITFCSPNFFIRSVVGNSVITPTALTNYLMEHNGDYNQLMKLNQKSCRYPYRTNLTDYVEQSLMNYATIPGERFVELLELIMIKYQDQLVRCLWNEKEIKCSDVFLNRFVDLQLCYTFNIGNEYVRFLENLKGGQMNFSNYNEKKFVMNNWMTNTFRLLVKVNQSESCGTRIIKRGAGLFAILMEKDTSPLQSVNTPIYLTPGYTHNVIMKPTIYRRYTEQMGNCTNHADIFLFSSGQKYLQSVCFMQCIIGESLRKCGCFPGYLQGYADAFRNLTDKFQVNESAIQACADSKQGTCCNEIAYNFLLKYPLVKVCPICKMPCFEKRYDYRLTKTLIPLTQLKKDLSQSIKQNELNNDTILRNNFLYVSFAFENKYAEIVEESPAFTLLDLFISYGSNIGLFIGMSFMSVFEITNHVIAQTIHVWVRHFIHDRRKQKTYIKRILIRKVN